MMHHDTLTQHGTHWSHAVHATTPIAVQDGA